MIALPLTAAERRLFEQSLYTGYELKITVQLLDLEHRYLSDLSSRLVDGQINGDVTADVERQLTMSLIDPRGTLGFDTDTPSDGALFADRMVRVVWSARSALLTKWVDVPVFCGPVTGATRDDNLVSVTAASKESLMIDGNTVAWYAHTYGKGWFVPSLVRDVLGKGGETKFSLPSWTDKTSRTYNVGDETVRWKLARAIVGPITDRHLFYDGRGVCVLRTTPKAPCFTFTENMLTSKPRATFDTSEVRNSVKVLGATPTGKPQIVARLGAPRNHPVSSWKLGRNGLQRIMLHKVEDDTLTTYTAAYAKAESVLEAVLMQGVDVQFESVPIPHLEPWDIYTLSTRDFSANQRVKQWSLPLKAGVPMTWGFLQKRSVNVRAIRGKK